MKRICITIALLLCLTFTMSGTTLAAEPEDGLDVDIVIVGNEPDVDIDIVGDDSTVYVNGWDITTPNIVHNSSGPDKWARTKIKEVILPGMGELQQGLTITSEGLAKLIPMYVDQVTVFEGLFGKSDKSLADLQERLDEQANALHTYTRANNKVLSTQQAQITEMEKQITTNYTTIISYLEYRLEVQKYNFNIWFLIMSVILVVSITTFSISLWRLRYWLLIKK